MFRNIEREVWGYCVAVIGAFVADFFFWYQIYAYIGFVVFILGLTMMFGPPEIFKVFRRK